MAKKLKIKKKIKPSISLPVNKIPIAKAKGTSPSKWNLYSGLIIALLAMLIYGNTLNNGFVLDDTNAITENHIVQEGISGIPTLLMTSYRAGYWTAAPKHYRPIPLVIFACIYEVFGQNPAPYHALNIILYGLAGFLLFFFLRSLLEKQHFLLPFLASLLWVAHPIHTEVVANIKSIDEIISFILSISALIFLLKHLKSDHIINLAISGILFFLSFFSKESGFAFIGVVPLMLFYFRPELSWKKIIGYTVVFVLGLGFFLASRRLILGVSMSFDDVMLIDNSIIGAENYANRIATGFFMLLKYLQLSVFPHPLSCDYAYNQIPNTNWMNPFVWLSVLILIAGGIFSVKRIAKREVWAFSFLLFLGTIFLYTNIPVITGATFGERFLFISVLGFCLGLSWGILKLLGFDLNQKEELSLNGLFSGNSVILGIFGAILLLYSGKTIDRNQYWESDFSLYSHDVKTAPNSSRLHYFYANGLMKEKGMATEDMGKRKKYLLSAVKEYSTALKIHPEYGDCYGQLGLAYYRLGDKNKAVENYTRAIELKTGKAQVYNNLAVIYGERQQHQKALETFKNSLKIDPRDGNTYKNIGSTYLFLKDYPNAILNYKEALNHKKNDPTILNYLSIAYSSLGDAENANYYQAESKKYEKK